jgi:hypothetical protein
MNLGWHNSNHKSCDAWLYCGDDMEFITPGWDDMALGHLLMGYEAVGGCDGYLSNEGCPTWIVMSEALCKAADTFVCPLYACEGTDKAWADVLNPMDLLFFDHSILIEHHHSTRGGSPDKTYCDLQAARCNNQPGHWAWVKDTQHRIYNSKMKDKK